MNNFSIIFAASCFVLIALHKVTKLYLCIQRSKTICDKVYDIKFIFPKYSNLKNNVITMFELHFSNSREAKILEFIMTP